MTPYPVQLQQLPSTPLAVIRQQVRPAHLSRVVPECCGAVWNALRAQGIRGGRHVALYWDGAIRLEAGAEVLGPFTEQEPVIRSATPAGLVAWVSHFGAYGTLGRAHEAVQAWCKVHGHRLAGPNWEIYGHWQSAWDTDPTLIQTDVFYLIASP